MRNMIQQKQHNRTANEPLKQMTNVLNIDYRVYRLAASWSNNGIGSSPKLETAAVNRNFKLHVIIFNWRIQVYHIGSITLKAWDRTSPAGNMPKKA